MPLFWKKSWLVHLALLPYVIASWYVFKTELGDCGIDLKNSATVLVITWSALAMGEQGRDGTRMGLRGQGAMLPGAGPASRTVPSAPEELRAEPPVQGLQEQRGETSSPRRGDGCCCC